jgi:catechol 2,3-dioxygenase-like lactoylglutathione lyase family enzyme
MHRLVNQAFNRMGRTVACFLLFSISLMGQSASGRPPSGRPKITGISHIAVYATDGLKTADFYQRIVGCEKMADFEDHPGIRYTFTDFQYVEVMPLPPDAGTDRLDHIAFRTNNVEALRRYLQAHGVPVPDHISVSKTDSKMKWLDVKDFEGNKVQFVEEAAAGSIHGTVLGSQSYNPKLVGHHIIHVGMLIRNRAEADSFYRDVLGFRLYWHGGMDPAKTDWVAMQVPDGTDWLEYMLTSGASGSGVPVHISQNAQGVLNHLSVGVPNMAAAVATLKSENRVGPRGTGPQIGKDGKWQFNDFDPDGTRLEYMEFTPVQKPCCFDFTGPHPSVEGN